MAATLLEIKSRKLLPRLDEEVPEEENPKRNFCAKLRNTKFSKRQAKNLEKKRKSTGFIRSQSQAQISLRLF